MSIIILLTASVSNFYAHVQDNDDLPHADTMEMVMGVTDADVPSTEELSVTENPFANGDNSTEYPWLKNAIKDVAYYLRSYKFNEYDRRYNKDPPKQRGQYFAGFPKPPLRSLHWEVHKHCEPSFILCMEYLYGRVQKVILKRKDDTSVVVNEQKWNKKQHEQQINSTEIDCRTLLEKDERYALPFEGPLERFQWRTTASYYLCWYTMNGVPDLEYFDQPCDNFANCLEQKYGANNLDPRASDAEPFYCSLYSLCPDPCCPLRHIGSYASCYESNLNPCYEENQRNGSNLRCGFEREKNTDFNDIVLNRWNVTCQCSQTGYEWNSKYGICVDINECTRELHDCDDEKEICVNLPGSFKCSCNWGYVWNNETSTCNASPAMADIKKVKQHDNKTTVVKNKISLKSLVIDLLHKLFEKKYTERKDN